MINIYYAHYLISYTKDRYLVIFIFFLPETLQLLLFFNFMRFGKLFVIKIPGNFQFYPLDPDPYLNGAQMRTWIRIRNIMCSNPNLTGADPGSFFSDPACHLIFDRSPIFR